MARFQLTNNTLFDLIFVLQICILLYTEVGLSAALTVKQTVEAFVPKPTLLRDIEEDAGSDMKLVEFKSFPGVKLATGDSNDKWSNSFRRAREWETDEVQMFCKKFQEYGKRGNFLDVGGHMGGFTLPMANCLGTDHTVVTVEAMPYQHKHLRAAIKANNFGNVHLYEYAIGPVNESGTIMRFRENHQNPAKSAYAPKRGNIETTATTLDQIYGAEPAMKKLFAMKIDIEGCEKMAMDGASNLMITAPPCMLMMEVNELSAAGKEEMLHLLGKYGYIRAEDLKAGGWVGLRNFWYVQKDFDSCVAKL